MVAEPVERMNYFQFQNVGAEDFRIQQAYHRDKLRRHNLGPHLWGIVGGCRIVESERPGDTGFVDLTVTPGLAIDGFGREIVLLEPVRVAPDLFTAFDGDRVLELWLHYDEYASRTGNDRLAICALDGAYSRVVESYRLLVGTFTPARDPLVVGGDEAKPALPGGEPDGGAPIEPADSSIAWQDFPDSERNAFWPVRLGSVRWDGSAGKFRPVAAPSVLVQGRRYAGLTGASLLAEGQELRIAPREPVAPANRDDRDFATIEGRVTVDGRIVAHRDIFLEGGMASFQGVGGAEAANPLWIKRLSTGGSGSDLRIHIGDTVGSTTARLTVGPGAPPHAIADEKIFLSVRADDRVDIPSGRLRFTGSARQAIDLSVPADDTQPGTNAIGWQGGAIYHRSTTGYYWFSGGVHSGTEGDPGAAGVRLMRLANDGSLYFGNNFRQLLNFNMTSPSGTQSSGIGVQEQTLYARAPQNFAWYRGGGHDNGALSPGGGARAMSLDGSSVLTVEGGIVSRGAVALWGTPLEFRTGSGGTDTDVLEIARVSQGSDATDLQVTIGDNTGGDDRFVVGPRVSGNIREQFVVLNSGDARVARDLYVRGRKAMFDVIAGEWALNALGAGSGTVNVPVSSSRLETISGAELMVALSDIRNVSTAVGARWRVSYTPGSRTLNPPNGATFPVHWTIEDIDGHILRFSYIAILYS